MKGFGTNNFKWGIKVFLIIVWAMLTIATCAGVWNSGAEPFAGWAALLLLIFNAAAITYAARAVANEKTGEGER